MSVTTQISYPVRLLMVFLVITATSAPINGQMKPRKLDDTTGTPPPDSGVKCGCYTCNNPCYQSPPPPSQPPPPKKKKTPPSPPKSQYGQPPPVPAGYVYLTGPPGDLYPIVTFNSGSSLSFAAALVGCGLVGLMVFW